MLGPVGAKRSFSGLKDHGLSAQRHATVCHGVNVTLLLPTPVIKRGIEKYRVSRSPTSTVPHYYRIHQGKPLRNGSLTSQFPGILFRSN